MSHAGRQLDHNTATDTLDHKTATDTLDHNAATDALDHNTATAAIDRLHRNIATDTLNGEDAVFCVRIWSAGIIVTSESRASDLYRVKGQSRALVQQ